MSDPSPDTPNVCPPAPAGFVACRHKRCLTTDEIQAELQSRRFIEHRRTTWWASTALHRADGFCECEPGGFCENGDGAGWVQAVLAVPEEADRD